MSNKQNDEFMEIQRENQAEFDIEHYKNLAWKYYEHDQWNELAGLLDQMHEDFHDTLVKPQNIKKDTDLACLVELESIYKRAGNSSLPYTGKTFIALIESRIKVLKERVKQYVEET